MNPVCGSDRRELAEQDRAEPAPLKLVRYGEGDLRAVLARSYVKSMAYDPLIRTFRGDDAEAAGVIDVDFSARFRRQRGVRHGGEKAQPSGLLRKRAEQVEQPAFVVRPDGAN